jgi:hypothetical protein
MTDREVYQAAKKQIDDWEKKLDGPDNLVILYYSGHGETAPPYKTFYWR